MDAVHFSHPGGQHGCFANASPHPLFITTTWRTAAHYIEGQRVGDPDRRREILMAADVATVRRISRDWPSRPDWAQTELTVVRAAIDAKVVQHADVREQLVATGATPMIDDTDERNVLGRIWMDVRDALLADGPYDELRQPMLPPWLEHPEIGRYSIGWRMGYGEDYMCRWGPWFTGLSSAGRRRYAEMFAPPPGEWANYWEREQED